MHMAVIMAVVDIDINRPTQSLLDSGEIIKGQHQADS
jgi:hypothetical protein